MAILKCNPTTPGRRHVVKVIDDDICKKNKNDKLKSLLQVLKKCKGRNNQGRITVRHIGGGRKRKYRFIDFKRNKDNILAVVKRLEYDPNRSANIALILYRDGEYRYILSPKGLRIGDELQSGFDVPIKVGNSLPMKNIPIGYNIHNIELKLGKGGQLVRSAGVFAQIISKSDKYVTLRMRSGEIRKIRSECRATIGEVGNCEHMLRSLGKAGAKRWRGIRPTVRGTAMNPVDHPHGGGEGRNFGKHPVSPWGKPTKGKKTRNNSRTDKYIVQRCI